MSLRTICQNVADSIPVAKPAVIVGSTDDTARLLLSMARRTGQELAKLHNWLDLVTEHTFQTAASQTDYDLPADFKHLVNDTLWDRDNFERVRGPLSAQDWQEHRSSVLASTATTWKKFRIRNVSGVKKFSIHPTPDAVENLVFEYQSSHWCRNSGGDGQSDWLADEDEGVVDEHLIELGTLWRTLNRLGMGYEEERDEYYREVALSWARDGGSKRLVLGGGRRSHLLGPSNIPDTGFGS